MFADVTVARRIERAEVSVLAERIFEAHGEAARAEVVRSAASGPGSFNAMVLPRLALSFPGTSDGIELRPEFLLLPQEVNRRVDEQFHDE